MSGKIRLPKELVITKTKLVITKLVIRIRLITKLLYSYIVCLLKLNLSYFDYDFFIIV